jgi:hypothetical protein
MSPNSLAAGFVVLWRKPHQLAVHRHREPVAQHAVHLRGVGIGGLRVVDAGEPHHRLPPVAQAPLVEVVVLREELLALGAQQGRTAARVGKGARAELLRRESGEQGRARERARLGGAFAIDQVQEAVAGIVRGRVHAQARIGPGHRDEERAWHGFQIGCALQLLLQRRRRGLGRAGAAEDCKRSQRGSKAHARTLAPSIGPSCRTNDRRFCPITSSRMTDAPPDHQLAPGSTLDFPGAGRNQLRRPARRAARNFAHLG